MFVVSLTYLVDLAAVEPHLADHIDYLDRYYASGHFLVSGRKEPRTGGVILAQAESRADLDAVLAQDPFFVHGLAAYDVTEFVASKTAPQLAWLRTA
ncbi:YciI family protein [Vibrio fluvialis]|uniref:YciI family protein n=1 Tax=Vibrio fluvialis TaxID=676 RepID=UPI001EEB75CA|nr:YciI family protein [Vibrio fluvialis]ELS8948190.1 GTP cyclohydrolase [Vibrio fluvialis]ELS8950134.1 GTP cyclohydrolase [Vibrio fluvialis]MCG6384425.1 YciI family protein [Vibrio fluvialis]